MGQITRGLDDTVPNTVGSCADVLENLLKKSKVELKGVKIFDDFFRSMYICGIYQKHFLVKKNTLFSYRSLKEYQKSY